MWLHRTAGVIVVAGLFWGTPALGQPPPPAEGLARAIRSGWLRFQVVSGRITIGARRLGSTSSTSTRPGGSEKLTIRFNNAELSMTYQHSTPQEELSIGVGSGNRISIRRSGKEGSTIVPVQFDQAPGEPISLALGPDDQQQVYRAATLWHLLVAQPDACRKHLVPLLELLRPGWRLAETATAIEAELLQAAALSQLPDRRQWDTLVQQLADERFAKREAADRKLRSAGQGVLGYLRGLDLDRLDAEQQYRIRRIITSLSRKTGDDTAEQFAAQLVGDPDAWLALLSRREESTRRLAARQLRAIVGEPIAFDPGADAATRKHQIEQLWAQIRAKRPETKD